MRLRELESKSEQNHTNIVDAEALRKTHAERSGKLSRRWQSARSLGIAILPLVAFGASAASGSTNEPAGINLGGTSFNDGFGGLSPGFVYQQYFQIEHFNAINDENGHAIGRPVFNNPSIDAVTSLNQLIYVSPYHLFGGVVGVAALLPVVDLSSHFDQPSYVDLKANGLGIGDLTWGPFLQMPPIISGGRPVFTQRFEVDAISPIGNYNTHKDINQSAGFWSLNPYWAMTVLPTPKFEMSTRLYYIYNFRNDDPASSTPLPSGSNYQAGQAAWANFDASYTISPGLNVGFNGYYFKQFTDDKADGTTQNGSETTNLSLGPGGSYALNDFNLFYANAYLPVVEKNTLNGFHLVFRWVHVF